VRDSKTVHNRPGQAPSACVPALQGAGSDERVIGDTVGLLVRRYVL
jgi:hypothetical protein